MKTSITLLAAALAAGFVWQAVAQDSGSQRSRTPLDLPSGGGGRGDDDEDSPESITFYGAEFEGDAFFWCLDKSCSMGWAGEIQSLKQETSHALEQLSQQAQFALIAFSSNCVVWPASEQPANATLANKSAAIGWVQEIVASGETCLAPAIVKTIQIATVSTRPRRQILLLGDGVPYCGGVLSPTVLDDIHSANSEQIPINTLYISVVPDGIPLFQAIAAENSGTFTIVD